VKYQIKIKILEKQSIIRSDIRRSGKTGVQDPFHFGADPEKMDPHPGFKHFFKIY